MKDMHPARLRVLTHPARLPVFTHPARLRVFMHPARLRVFTHPRGKNDLERIKMLQRKTSSGLSEKINKCNAAQM